MCQGDVNVATDVLSSFEDAIERIFGLELDVMSDDEVLAAMGLVERLSGRIDALSNRLLGIADRRGLHSDDGHATVKVMIRHRGRLSEREALARVRVLKALRDLPTIAEAFEAAEIGVDQVRLLGRVYANPRVRDAMVGEQERFLGWASSKSFRDFERAVRSWERLMDDDGAEPANERNHDNRDAKLIQDYFSLGWNLTGGYGAMQGAAMRDIFDHYIAAEWQADWEKAKAELGDHASYSDMPRSEPQRRADALWQVFQDAAGADQGAVPPTFVHNIVWDSATFEEMVARLAGRPARKFDADSFRCETIDGVALDPTEAAANAAINKIRRVVVDASGVVTDMGRARLFAGNARTAVQLQSTECVWPGCCVAASRCEADHLLDHSQGGRTNPGNGAPLCGKHNRWKQKGFTVFRDAVGGWHTLRPDGSEIPDPAHVP